MLWWVARKTWLPQAASIAVTSYSALVICDAMKRLQMSL
ncbi:unknown [Firmicutes bacterium CAG:124]|nr:unknown [Firmicutes bacterium CAG:124]